LSLDWQLLQGCLERIPVILSPAVKKKTYPADEHYWSRKIAELVREKKGDVTEKEILQILKQKTFSDRITGEFLAGHDQFGPHIILYYNVIGGEPREKMLAGFANVLAHEYMHYMEYRYCSAMGVADYTNQPLSEGMADFFGALYSIRRNCAESRKVAHARYKTWVKRFGSRWPYAHALYFYTIGSDRMGFSPNYADYERHGSLQKLKTIFHHCDQPKLAYDILLNT